MLQDVIDTIAPTYTELQALCNAYCYAEDFGMPRAPQGVVDEILDVAYAVLIPAQKGLAAFSI